MFLLRIKHLYSRWKGWCAGSVNRSIFGAAMSVGVLTLLVRVLSVVKEIKVASAFGLGDSLDAFLMAYVVPSFAIAVFAGSFYSAFIPVLVAVREKSGHAAEKQLFSSIAFIALAALSVLTGVLALTGEWLIKSSASGFDPSKLAKTISLFYQMLPLILIGGASLFGGAMLNAQKKFALVASAPIATPIAIILLLDFFQKAGVSPQQLVMGTLIGSFLELCIVLWGLHKIGYLCLPSWRSLDVNSRKVVSQYLPLIGGSVLMGGTTVVDQVMAAWLAPGSVSALSYGIKVTALITGLAATTLGAVALPYLSQQIAERNYSALKHTLVTYSKLIIFISVPLTLLGLLVSEKLTAILFERGAFVRADTVLVSEIMRYSLLQTPFYILGTLFARFISVMSGNKFLLYGAIISLLINAVMNFILMKIIGVAGIALSTSIVYLIAVIFLYWILVLTLSKEIKK